MLKLISFLLLVQLGFAQSPLLTLMIDETSWSPMDASVTPTAWYIGDTGKDGIYWRDQSGNDNDLNCIDPAYSPTVGTLNGHNTFIFNSQIMRNESGFAINQPITIYVVAKQITWAANSTWWDGKTGDRMLLRQRNSTPEIDIYSGNAWIEGNTDLAVNTFGIIRAVYSGASSSIRVNDNSATTGNAGTNNSDGFVLGATWSFSYTSNIEVAEVIIYSGSLTADDDIKIMDYLNTKYAIYWETK